MLKGISSARSLSSFKFWTYIHLLRLFDESHIYGYLIFGCEPPKQLEHMRFYKSIKKFSLLKLLRKNLIFKLIFAVRSFMRLKCKQPVINLDSQNFAQFTNVDAHCNNGNLNFSCCVRCWQYLDWGKFWISCMEICWIVMVKLWSLVEPRREFQATNCLCQLISIFVFVSLSMSATVSKKGYLVYIHED